MFYYLHHPVPAPERLQSFDMECVRELIDAEKNADMVDLPPEFCRYRDEGCELAPSCLNCPLPQCVEDIPWGRLKLIKGLRDREIRRQYTEEKKTVAELAQNFHISTRTVHRALAGGRRK